MATNPKAEPPLPKQIKDDVRDVAEIWSEALKAYEGVVEFSLTSRAADAQGFVDLGTDEMKKFHRFRHDEKRVDALRSLFVRNIELIGKGLE